MGKGSRSTTGERQKGHIRRVDGEIGPGSPKGLLNVTSETNVDDVSGRGSERRVPRRDLEEGGYSSKGPSTDVVSYFFRTPSTTREGVDGT